MLCWIICGTISVILAFCGAILSWRGRKQSELKTTLLLLGGFIVLAVFFIRYPYFYNTVGDVHFIKRLLYPVFYSFTHTMQTISLDEMYADFLTFPVFVKGAAELDSLTQNSMLNFLLMLYMNILHVMAPVIGGAFILTVLENIFPRLHIKMHPFKEKCLFSELNLRSIALAEDISNNGMQDCNSKTNKPMIIFTNESDDNQKATSELSQRAKKIGAKCIENEISSTKMVFSRRCKAVTYFLIEEDETNNVSGAVEIVEKIKSDQYKNRCIYVFSHQKEAEIILDSLGKKNAEEGSSSKFKIRLIDDARSAIYHLLNNKPLFSYDADFKGISLLVVGCGWMGREAVKAVSWCGQLGDSFSLKINAVDSNGQNIKELEFECPELFALNELYNISSKRIDVKSKEFETFLRYEADDTTHVIVALGSDDLNISTAAIIRSAFARLRLSDKKYASPVIHVLIENQAKSKQIYAMKDSIGNPYNIKPFGSIQERFCFNVAINSKLDDLAKKVHLACRDKLEISCGSKEYDKEISRFEQIMYNQRSSYAAAVHIKYKMFSLGVARLLENGISPEIIKVFAEKLKDEKNALWLMQLEHTRWNAYMRSEGFRTPSKNELDEYYNAIEKQQNLLARLHPCLVPCDASNNLCKAGVDNGKIALKENPDPAEIQEAWDILCENIEDGLETADSRFDELDRVSLSVYKFKKDLATRKDGNKYALDTMNDNFKAFDLEIVQKIPIIFEKWLGKI